jgi:transposase
LCGLVINELKGNPQSGDVFIFINKPQTHIKLLFWDKTGFVIYYKRLEVGTFELPDSKASHIEIAREDLMMILEGISLKKAKKRKRYIS